MCETVNTINGRILIHFLYIILQKKLILMYTECQYIDFNVLKSQNKHIN